MEEDKYKAEEWFATNIEVWYEKIKDHTMKSSFLKIPKNTLKDMLNEIETPSKELPSSIVQLTKEIDLEVKKFNSAFVKLSCRSPKDVTISSERMKKIYLKDLAKLESYVDSVTENMKSALLYQAHIKALKVKNAKDAMDMFLQSQRIKQDIEMSLQDDSEIQVIIREWVSIPISREFRGFCYNKKLTGLSQYFDLLFFPNMKKNKDIYLKDIQNLFDSITKEIPCSNFIIDFGISDSGRVYVIELNPWTVNAGNYLFI